MCAAQLALSSCDIQPLADAGRAARDAAPGCELLQGTFAFEYRRRSGDCDDHQQALGALNDQLQIVPERVRFVDGRYVSDQRCVRDRVETVESCEVEVARTCVLRAPLSGTYTVIGRLSPLDDGTLKGVLTLTVTNFGVMCTDVYAAVAEPVD